MKNKTTKKIICGGLATVLLSSSLVLPTTSLASTSKQKVQDYQQEETFSDSPLTELDNLIAEKYITFDSPLKQYKVNPSIGSEMTTEKIEAVNKPLLTTVSLPSGVTAITLVLESFVAKVSKLFVSATCLLTASIFSVVISLPIDGFTLYCFSGLSKVIYFSAIRLSNSVKGESEKVSSC